MRSLDRRLWKNRWIEETKKLKRFNVVLKEKSSIFFTARHYASALYAIVVCPSVRPSVTRRHCTKTAKRKITQTTPYVEAQTTLLVSSGL